MDSLEKFHARLKQLIAEDGTKLRPLAKKLGVSSIGILSDWQNGNKTPRADSVLNSQIILELPRITCWA